MKRLLVLAVPAAVLAAGVLHLALTATDATAAPAWGGACLSCHGADAPGALEIVGHDGLLDPDETGTGAPDRGPLPVFRVAPGQSVSLMATLQSLALGDTYAVALRRLRHDGVVHGRPLDASADCAWADWASPESYLTEPYVSYRWGDGPSLFVHELQVAAAAPADVFDLVLEVAGSRPDGTLYSAREHLYVEIVDGVLFADGFESGDTSAWSESVAESAGSTPSGNRRQAPSPSPLTLSLPMGGSGGSAVGEAVGNGIGNGHGHGLGPGGTAVAGGAS